MKLSKAIKLIKNKLDIECAQDGNKYQAIGNRWILEFYEQEGRVLSIRIRGRNDIDDRLTDYVAGIDQPNMSVAIESFGELEQNSTINEEIILSLKSMDLTGFDIFDIEATREDILAALPYEKKKYNSTLEVLKDFGIDCQNITDLILTAKGSYRHRARLIERLNGEPGLWGSVCENDEIRDISLCRNCQENFDWNDVRSSNCDNDFCPSCRSVDSMMSVDLAVSCGIIKISILGEKCSFIAAD